MTGNRRGVVGRKRKRSDDSGVSGDSGVGSSTACSPGSTPSPASSTSSYKKVFACPLRRSARTAAARQAKLLEEHAQNSAAVEAAQRDCDDPDIKFNNNYKDATDSPPKKRLRIDIPVTNEQSDNGQTDIGPPPEPRRSPNGYLLPDPLPLGLTIRDLRGRTWSLGKSVGVGGFGEIYSAVEILNSPSPEVAPADKCQYVVKVEPFLNGPLFVEVNFYLRTCKREAVAEYKHSSGLAHLGVPHIEGSGSFRHRDKRFRFMVIPRYGTDLQTLLDDSKLTLSPESASQIACQVIDSYQYIHSKGYVHKDVKGSNLLFEYSCGKGRSPSPLGPPVAGTAPTGKGRNIFLVDYGLVSKYTHMGVHKPYVRDERCAHEGTLEYTARDFHLGCVSRRGDLEVLLYCVIDWIGGKLPWDLPTMAKPPAIHEAKIKAFHDPAAFMAKAFPNSAGMQGPPPFLLDLMKYINGLSFEEQPDYDLVRSIFSQAMKKHQSAGIGGSSGLEAAATAAASLDSSADEVTLSIEIRSPPQQQQQTQPGSLPEPTQSPPTTKKKRAPKKRVLRRRAAATPTTSPQSKLQTAKDSGSGGSQMRQTSEDQLSQHDNSLGRLSEDESSEDEGEEVEQFLSDMSAKRFEMESGEVIRASDAECLLNPTPLMMNQMAKIRQRAIDKTLRCSPNDKSPKNGKGFRKRNRSLSFSRASLTSRKKSVTPPPLNSPPAKRMKAKSTEKKFPEAPATSREKMPRSAKSELCLPKTINKIIAKKRVSIDPPLNLRRSPRILDPIVNNGGRSPNKKASIRQNLYNWFVNGTKSILRISQNN